MKGIVVAMGQDRPECSGYCMRCGRVHSLDALLARRHAGALMERLDRSGRIDFSASTVPAASSCLTEVLFGPARGKMFGVLLCRDTEGKEVVLHAFSGQFNGMWQVLGWVDPLFDLKKFHRCNDPQEKEIKAISRALEEHPVESRERLELSRRRKECSRKLMEEIFRLYRLPNFRGEERALAEVFTGDGGMPTGTGDCCAPKLLAHAARNNLIPLSLAEFYYGRETVSRSCRHKHFYPPCVTRCRPILGYMLCGVERVE